MPVGVFSVTIKCTGAGGGGGSTTPAGGGGGGAWAQVVYNGNPGDVLPVSIGGGGTAGVVGGDTTVKNPATTVICKGVGGAGANTSTGGAGGLAANCIGSSASTGGTGANGAAPAGGGGGSGADTAAGNNGAGTAGGASVGGQSGAGGNGGPLMGNNGTAGGVAGGGGGGGAIAGSSANGGNGRATFTYPFADDDVSGRPSSSGGLGGTSSRSILYMDEQGCIIDDPDELALRMAERQPLVMLELRRNLWLPVRRLWLPV